MTYLTHHALIQSSPRAQQIPFPALATETCMYTVVGGTTTCREWKLAVGGRQQTGQLPSSPSHLECRGVALDLCPQWMCLSLAATTSNCVMLNAFVLRPHFPNPYKGYYYKTYP